MSVNQLKLCLTIQFKLSMLSSAKVKKVKGANLQYLQKLSRFLGFELVVFRLYISYTTYIHIHISDPYELWVGLRVNSISKIELITEK